MDEENQQSPATGSVPTPATISFSSLLSGQARPTTSTTHRKDGTQTSQELEDIAEIGSLTEADLCSKGSQEDPDSSPDKSTEEVKEGIELENLDASLTEAELTAPSSHNPNVQKQVSNRHLKFNFVTEKHRIRQESTTNMFGGFGEMNQAVKLYQKIGANVKDGKYETLDKLYMGSSEVAIMKESRIKFQAREKSIRQTTAFTLFLFACYFLVCVPILVHVGGIGFQNALLYCVYSMTSTGFGSVKVPLTSSAFLVFLICLMLYGVACVVLVASTLYLYISLQNSKLKKNLDKNRAKEALKDGDSGSKSGKRIPKPRNWVSALRSCASFIEDNVRKSEGFRLAVIGGYLLTLLLVGAFAMMGFEGWTFVQALYFASYCMTSKCCRTPV